GRPARGSRIYGAEDRDPDPGEGAERETRDTVGHEGAHEVGGTDGGEQDGGFDHRGLPPMRSTVTSRADAPARSRRCDTADCVMRCRRASSAWVWPASCPSVRERSTGFMRVTM